MNDITIVDNDTVCFHKKLWHESEVIVAKCFNFEVDVDKGVITCTLSITSKRALYEFIKLAFRNFSESVNEFDRREKFFSHIDAVYSHLDSHANSIIQRYVPYWNNLYEHQTNTLLESLRRKYNFYAMDMGTGKTLTSATVSRALQIQRTVIVCPNAVKWNWFRDLTGKFGYNEIYFSIIDKSKKRTIRALHERFVVINYDIVGKFKSHLLSSGIGHFILDEAHMLKNHTSQRYKAIKEVIDACPDARITFLSGTPVKNRVDDVFGYLRMINHELGSSHKKFKDEYTIRSNARGGERVTGGRNLQDLHLKMSNFMIRVRKEDCLDLPEKVFLSYKYEMDDYRDEYNKVIEELSAIKDLRSLTGNLHSLNIITTKAKLSGVKEIVESILLEGRKVVVFGSYKEPLNELEIFYGDECVKIDGSVDAYDRDQRIQRFWNDENCKIFLGNMQAAGVGINLTNASDVVFLNFPFTPAELYQAIDRCHRIGQGNSVNVHYTFCENSIDEYIYEIIVDKERDINTLIDQGKEVMYRENFTEILMKKLLNKDDIDDNNGNSESEIKKEETKMDEESFIKFASSIEESKMPEDVNSFNPPPFDYEQE